MKYSLSDLPVALETVQIVCTDRGYLNTRDCITEYVELVPELLEALEELLASEESPHSETVRYLAREKAREVLAKVKE